jgi:nucleotide-binding universal stress UspA family protein
MFRHILIPVDLSERNKRAIDFSVNLAILSQAQITLLHVIELIDGATFDEFADFYRTLHQQAETKIHDLMAPHRDTTIPISFQLLYGDRTREILRFAEEEGVDLIVLNSRQLDPAKPTQGWGSISHKIGILAQCPVMLMK